ncbi:RHS repeat-associated core domain-containing protein [Streptomyces sp. NPDC051563]|uniref:RHS repeat-associated core domain-containing protein n=1 Tax=Streptomyces sp. NPDC051563 TaxID=3365659 RepID=UPI00379F29CE
MTPAVAAPGVLSQLVALTESTQPVLTAKTAAGSGQVTVKFYAGTYAGGGANDMVDGTAVTVAAGEVARLKVPDPLRTGTQFDWQAQACTGSDCTALTARQSTRVSPMTGAGERPGATRLKFAAGDHVGAQVDVGTGNLLVTTGDLTLPGISGDTGLGVAYNSASIGTEATGSAAAAGYGWKLAPYDISLTVHEEGSVTYYGRGGTTWLFTNSASGLQAPAGAKAKLVKNGDGSYTLTANDGSGKQDFDTAGKLTKSTDRNGNATTLTYNGALPSTIVSTRGTQAQKTAAYATASGHVTTLTQTGQDGTKRTVTYTVNAAGDLSSVKDTLGRTTSFGYTAHKLTSITNPGGGVTRFAHGSVGVTSITQENKASGSPGDSVTRLSYADPAKTVVASPNTDQAQAITAVPHTTYELTDDKSGRVKKATDAEGRERSKTYTANFDTATATDGTGAGAGTTTNTFGANSGESVTKSESATGASFSAAYGNTAAGSKYLPSESTDGQSNKSTYTYNGAGNLSETTDANASTAKVDYNADGTVKTSTDPGNTTSTTYNYDTATHQATSVDPAGGSLKVKSYTYDTFGRMATAKDGRGTTRVFTYDDGDRISKVDYSDTTPDVSYTYDGFGRVATRTDASGTTTYGYDDLGRLTSRTATSGGGTLAYRYDKNGNQTALTDARGTTTYSYDDSNKLTQLTTNAPSTSTKIGFVYDDRGRRTDTYFGTNDARTIFKARVHQDYDAGGRISRVWADQGPATSPTRQFDTTYCRAIGTSGTCSTATGDDRSLLQWSKDNLSGKTTSYGYDTANRLTQVATSGGGKTYTYTYDARGNRKTSSDGATTQTLAYDAANQITTAGYAYDGQGNLTTTPALSAVTYDAAGRMATAKTANGTGTYTYAGTTANELVHQTTDKGESVDYVHGRTDQYGMPVIEQVKLAAGTAYIEHDPTTGQPLALRTTNGYEAYYIIDGLGSPVQFINQSTVQSGVYEYDPYGAAQTVKSGTAATENPYRFVGGTYDRTTGYLKYGQRWYDPTTGRFTSQDPLTFLADPAQGNRYAYAGDDPINNIDPSGKSIWSSVTGAVGMANDINDVGEAWNAGLEGNWGEVAGITFGMAFGTAVEAACIGVGGYVGGPMGAAAVALPCIAAGEAAGDFAKEQTVEAWS